MTWLYARVGPGMMLAAIAVGVSHLVQSTRAGADYGLSFLWLIALIVVLKYPAFRFAVDYASATGRTLISGYAGIGRVALAWLAVAFFVDMFIATAAVALVTAGLFSTVLHLPFSGPEVAVSLTVVSALILLNGHYARAERLVTVLVVLFSVLTCIATLFALPLLGGGDRGLFAEIVPSRALAVFVIAVAGWMPMPMTGSIFQSMWIRERRRSGDFDHARALHDFRLGYGLTLVLALCFVVMGTAVLFETDRVVPASAGAFATELLSIFTGVIGDWTYPVIAVAAIAVMWSTLLALLDALPRVTDRLFGILAGRPAEAPGRYTRFLIVQVAGVATCDAESDRHGIEPVGAVEFTILQGVNDVEACKPKNHGETEIERYEKLVQIDRQIHRRQPRADRRDGKGQTQEEMRRPGKPLGERVEKNNRQSDGRERETNPIELIRCKDKNQSRESRQQPRLPNFHGAAS